MSILNKIDAEIADDARQQMEARIAVLREALTFYAERPNYFDRGHREANSVGIDLGEKARSALAHTDERAEALLRVVEAARQIRNVYVAWEKDPERDDRYWTNVVREKVGHLFAAMDGAS